jgi:hypothetical protein
MKTKNSRNTRGIPDEDLTPQERHIREYNRLYHIRNYYKQRNKLNLYDDVREINLKKIEELTAQINQMKKSSRGTRVTQIKTD